MEKMDKGALQEGVEGYVTQSKLLDEHVVDLAERDLFDSLKRKGFSFPTNEGYRKITKRPEMELIEDDPVLAKIQNIIRPTIKSVISQKKGGLYAGVNAFHHGHLAYLSKSEAIASVDINKLVPYGFAFIVGLVGGAKTPEDFREQVGLLATNPDMLRDIFSGTELEETILVSSDSDIAKKARNQLVAGLLSTMNEFNPNNAQKDEAIPPVFCNDPNAYNYFRSLVLSNKVTGFKAPIEGKGFIKTLADSMSLMGVSREEMNTVYVSSCFDPRFLGPEERKKFIRGLNASGYRDFQMVESFLNGGWIVYPINKKE